MQRKGKQEVLLVDSREQKPLWQEGPVVRRVKLEVGDYTTTTLLNTFHVERKSPGDLYGSITKGHGRFKRMLTRAKERGTALVVAVECEEQVFYRKAWPGGYRCQVKGNVLAKIISGIRANHGILFVWCSNRSEMKRVIKELFNNYKKEPKDDSY